MEKRVTVGLTFDEARHFLYAGPKDRAQVFYMQSELKGENEKTNLSMGATGDRQCDIVDDD